VSVLNSRALLSSCIDFLEALGASRCACRVFDEIPHLAIKNGVEELREGELSM